MRTHLFQIAILTGILSISGLVLAADDSSPILVMHNQRFNPDKLMVPAGVRMKIVLRNLDSTPNEFESYDLAREVIVPGHGEVAIYVGPLNPGIYQIFNDYNLAMQGSIVVKPSLKNRE